MSDVGTQEARRVATEIAGFVHERLVADPVALVGSWARGEATAGSDIDLVGYLRHGDTCTDALDVLVDDLHEGTRRPVVTPCCWSGDRGHAFASFDHAGMKVDLTLRDRDDTTRRVSALVAGRIEFRCAPGAAHPAPDLGVVAELTYGLPVRDPSGWWADLRATVAPLPDRVRAALTQRLSLECTYLLRSARAAARRGSRLEAVAGCTAASRLAITLVQVRDGVLPSGGRIAYDDVARSPGGPAVLAAYDRVCARFAAADLTGAVDELTASLTPVL